MAEYATHRIIGDCIISYEVSYPITISLIRWKSKNLNTRKKKSLAYFCKGSLIIKWWGYLGLNQGPIGYAYYYSFRYLFRVWSLDYPFIPSTRDVCHLVSTPFSRELGRLGSGLPTLDMRGRFPRI